MRPFRAPYIHMNNPMAPIAHFMLILCAVIIIPLRFYKNAANLYSYNPFSNH